MERFHYESEEDFSFDLEDPQVWTIWTVKDREQTGSHVGSSKSLMSFSTELEAGSSRATSTPHSTTSRPAAPRDTIASYGALFPRLGWSGAKGGVAPGCVGACDPAIVVFTPTNRKAQTNDQDDRQERIP